MPKVQGLSDKERLYVGEYLVDLNRSAAYIRAGFKPGKTPEDTGSRAAAVHKKPLVKAAIDQKLAEREEKTGITAERVVRELAKVGFASMRRFITIDANGQPQINLTETPHDDLDAISEVQTETVLEREGSGDEATTHTIRKTKIKLHDKLRALHDLAEHTGVFRESDKNKATALAEAFQQIWARGSKAPLRRGGPPK